MNANRFFSVPYDGRNDIDMLLLRERQGGIVAYGRWIALLGILYDVDGTIDLERYGSILERELELDSAGLKAYLQDCADVGFLSSESLSCGMVASTGVCDEIEYRKSKVDAGRMGCRPRKAPPKSKTKST